MSDTPAMTTSGPPPPPLVPDGNLQFSTPGGGGGGVMGSVVTPSSQPFMLYSSGLSGSVLATGSGPKPPVVAPAGIRFSSDSESSGSFDYDDEEEEEVDDASDEEELERPAGSGQKWKRSGNSKGGGGGKRRMIDFFEGLMKQVMQKQEAMQQRFLEIIEKREQDSLMRDEVRKRQEAVRLSRQQNLAAQERTIAASRDAAIGSFLQNITGQTIQLPQPVYTSAPTAAHHVAPPPSSAPAPAPAPASTPPSSRQQFQPMAKQQQQVQHHQYQTPPPWALTDAIMAVPERLTPPQDAQTGGSMRNSEPASSRWPKAEVPALIKLRSNMDNRCQEAGPKGPLWGEISAGMKQMGYNRSSKRCKEKWDKQVLQKGEGKQQEAARGCQDLPVFQRVGRSLSEKEITDGQQHSSSSSVAACNYKRPGNSCEL